MARPANLSSRSLSLQPVSGLVRYAMATPAEDPQMHGQGPGRVSLSDSSGTQGEKSDSYQTFPDYSQLVPVSDCRLPTPVAAADMHGRDIAKSAQLSICS